MLNLAIGKLRHKGAVTCRMSAFTSDLCPAVTISEICHWSIFGEEDKQGHSPLAKNPSYNALLVQTIPMGEGDTAALLTVKVSHVISAVHGFMGNSVRPSSGQLRL